jgi:hypothetical protein
MIMKRFLLLFVILFATFHLSAQSNNTTKNWFDGHNYYTSEKVGERLYRFRGESADNENNFTFYIEETIDGPRFRKDENSYGYMPIRAPFESRAQKTEIAGNQVITILNDDFQTVWILVRTEKDHRDCLATQLWHSDKSVEWNMTNMIFNPYYLSSLSKTQLRYMRETLCDKLLLSGIESHNLSLITTELEVPDYDRYIVADYMARMNSEDDEYTIVHNALEFINAIENGAKIKVADNTVINLSEILGEQDAFVGKGRKRLSEDNTDITKISGPTIVSEYVFDGWQLDLVNFSDMVIAGGYNSHIVVDPAYAFVLNFVNCNDITIENLTMGHTVEGYCMGGVIGAENCNPIYIYHCDLYGCGAYGFVARESSFCMDYTIIRDCSYGIMQLYGIKDGQFNCCDFYRNREYSMVEIDGNSSPIYFYECRFAQNNGVLFATDSKVVITSSLIRHQDPDAMGSLYNVDMDNDTQIYYDNKSLPYIENGPTKQSSVY